MIAKRIAGDSVTNPSVGSGLSTVVDEDEIDRALKQLWSEAPKAGIIYDPSKEACNEYAECGCNSEDEHCMYCLQPKEAHSIVVEPTVMGKKR